MSEGVFRNPFDVIDDEGDGEVVLNLPQEIEQAFKKIAKRDSTTRSKGFNELIEVLRAYNKEEVEELAGLMNNSFIKIFEKFAICSEKASRLHVAELTEILISKSDPKTFLQPILKEILTIWLLSLFDPINEVSYLQRKTLESVFPAGTKLKILLEKFDKLIWSHLLEFTGTEKIERLKEIAVKEMEGSSEEASNVVELIKTEIIGVMTLLLGNSHSDSEVKSLLFLKDKEFGSARRAALYRFNLKYNATWLIQSCKTLLLKETNPTALVASLDLLEKTGISEFNAILEDEKFVLNFVCYAPIPEFKRFSRLLKSADSLIAKCCTGNLMNKDRFVSFWRDIAKVCISGDFRKRILLIESLLFPQSRIINNSAITVFIPLNAEESMNCVLEAFNSDEIVEVCKGKACPQSIYTLSMIKSEASYLILEDLMKQLKVSNLQSKELMKVLPEDILARGLSERIDEMSTSEIIRLCQNLSNDKAVEMFKEQNSEFWEHFMAQRTTLLTREIIKNVLFHIEGFRQYAREHDDNVLLISCAFESEVDIYDPEEMVLNHEIFEEAFNEVEVVEVCSPTLKIALKNHIFASHPKVRGLRDKRKLYEFLEIHKDEELFEAMECEDEDFYPIGFIENALLENINLPSDPVEIVMYKNKCNPLSCSLLSFPLKKFENQRKVVKCAFIHNSIDLITFKVKEEDFDTVSDDFELYSLSKVLVLVDIPSSINSFKDSLKLYCSLSNLKDPQRINQVLDEFIFGDCLNCKTWLLSLACSIHPILPVRSDNLAGIISRTLEDEDSIDYLLILVSVHLEREELRKEFWQVQFKENLKELLTFNPEDEAIRKELKLRVSAAIWNKLTDPEIELLTDCNYKSALKEINSIDSGSFEEFGLARLILMSSPFVRESFEILKLIKFYETDGLTISPAIELAYRSVYLQLHLDEQLVAASVHLESNSEGELDEKIQILFPFYHVIPSSKQNKQKFAILLEMFVSAAEGSRDDWKLLGIFADALKTRLLPLLKDIVDVEGIEGTLESFDFTPRDYNAKDLIKHVLHRFCAIFPLLINQGLSRDIFKNTQITLEQREIERIRRQPKISIESVEIHMKPIITSTTKLVNLRVRFADEITLVIDLMLPRAFPLETIKIEGRDKSGLAESKWKATLLSLQTLLHSPTFSGNLVEIVKKWQANALKLFQGLEQCAVCYCVLHPSDKSLPGPGCKQCKHKFHATCLYKWFKSSGNATCPLCRALF